MSSHQVEVGDYPAAFAIPTWLAVLLYLVPILVSIGAAAFAIRLTRQANTWNQKRATIDAANRWNDGEIENARESFRKKIPFDLPRPHSRFRQLVASGDQDLRSNLVTLLNHLDIVSMGVVEGTLSERETAHLYAGIMDHFVTNYVDFIIEHYRGRAWPDPHLRTFYYLLLWARRLGIRAVPNDLEELPAV